MRRFLTLLLAVLAFAEATAQDSVLVQTLDFNMITQRRGIFKFPDNNDKYRKILMFYTLKCDPRTTQDQFDCGEWDYLTYNFVYKHLGTYDSTAKTHPLYKIGFASPDTIFYSNTKTYSNYQSYDYTRVFESTTTEKEVQIGTGTSSFNLKSNPFRMQFILSKVAIKDKGLAKGNIDKLYLFVPDTYQGSCVLKDLKVRMKNKLSAGLPAFENASMVECYSNDLTLTKGKNIINLTTPFNWSGSSNIIVELSYSSIEGTAPALVGTDSSVVFLAEGPDTHMKFDGINDNVYCGQIPELKSATKFTYETWLRVDQWETWNKVLGLESKVHIELGQNVGDLYCIVRNPDNCYGKTTGAMAVGEWVYIAMVYDGTQTKNSDKLKLYINGEQKTLEYNLDIPAVTPKDDLVFSVTGTEHGTAALKGAYDEVRVWSEPLNAATIKAWYDKSLTASHPNYAKLLFHYDFNNPTDAFSAKDKSGKGKDGTLIGVPVYTPTSASDLHLNNTSAVFTPNITLVQGTYVSHLDSTLVPNQVENPLISIIRYKIVNYKPVIDLIDYKNRSGWSYTYSPSGARVDSVYKTPDGSYKNDTLKYFDKPFEKTDRMEIGRYITPYGKMLSLGPDGFTWVYDVTDYAQLLKGDVDFEAGNMQELIDVKFLFIKGVPPRDVLKITKVWNSDATSYSYGNLSNDKSLSKTTVDLLPETKQIKIKTRLTGHGHNSNDGKYPHCCEWKDNTHSIFVDGNKEAEWSIFRNTQCALNPVYPQGGTWPGSREGWCPGDVVYDYDFELAKYAGKDSISLDYDITKVPADNLGMGGGNYVTSMQLFQYGAPNYAVDAEIYDVITPNSFDYYSRVNPICSNPNIVVRNNGKDTLRELSFEYGVSGNSQKSLRNWSGKIAPNTFATIDLPIASNSFWIGDNQHKFTVTVKTNNGITDENAVNDSYTTSFKMPDLYSDKVVIWFQTNKRPGDFQYMLYDIKGDVIFEKGNLQPETLYRDTVNVPDGCYTMEMIDYNNLGLSYWAYPEQGSGYLRIHSAKTGNVLKTFNPDFGRGIKYSFNIGDVQSVQEPNLNDMLQVYPNPSSNNLTLELNCNIGSAEMQIIDQIGRIVNREKVYVTENFKKAISLDNYAIGSYTVRIFNKQYDLSKVMFKK